MSIKMHLPDSAENIRRVSCSAILKCVTELRKNLSVARTATKKEGISKEEKARLLTTIEKLSQLLDQMEIVSDSFTIKRPKPDLRSV